MLTKKPRAVCPRLFYTLFQQDEHVENGRVAGAPLNVEAVVSLLFIYRNLVAKVGLRQKGNLQSVNIHRLKLLRRKAVEHHTQVGNVVGVAVGVNIDKRRAVGVVHARFATKQQ